MPIDLSAYNDRVKAWGRNTTALAVSAANQQSVVHRKNSPSKSASLRALKDKYRVNAGAVDRVTITFPRTLIYTIKGAGKGVGGSKGSRWITAKGEVKTTNPRSLGKLGVGRRKAKDFINHVLDGPQGVERLADIAAEELGTAIITSIRTQ